MDVGGSSKVDKYREVGRYPKADGTETLKRMINSIEVQSFNCLFGVSVEIVCGEGMAGDGGFKTPPQCASLTSC